jgi:glycosyltransferase involved in cell wall biosynthesis
MVAKEFARRGQQVIAYSRSFPELPLRDTDEHGIRHVRLQGFDLRPNRWIDHFYGFRYSRVLAPVLENADVTSFHTPFSFILAQCPRLGVCTHTIHRTPKWPLPLYRRLDRLYCGSDAVVNQARRICPSIRTYKRIHNCIALPPEPVRQIEKTPTTGLRFLYVGRFVADKGIESLVRGFARSLLSFPGNRLDTIGPQQSEQGGDTNFFRAMCRHVEQAGLTDRVSFLPPEFDREKLDARIAAADVICVPSLAGETFSMAILEAMALAKPVLVSDFGPMTEAVDHLHTGYVARSDDADSLCEGIEFFSARPEELPAIGYAGFMKAKRSFSVDQVASEYLEDFAQLIEAKRQQIVLS